MSTPRVIALAVLTLTLVVGGCYLWLTEQSKARLRDYTNLITETHGRAMSLFDDAQAKSEKADAEILAMRFPPADELAAVKDSFLLVATRTREEKEALARVVPPPEADKLLGDTLEFLEQRAIVAETNARYFELLEKGQRGEKVTQADLRRQSKLSHEQHRRMLAMGKAMATLKDELATQ